MGAVYLSYSRGGQAVALKLIRREFGDDPEFQRRFEQEVQAARRVRGYHLVPVVDHDTSGAQPWLASLFVPGLSLHEALSSHGPLPLPAVLRLVGRAAQGLASMHTVGVVHRDLKPGNILLGADGPHVIDFGIARAADATHITRSGGLIGTPQFMSPEQALGEEVGPPSDVFSLGLIAAVAATGRHPYGEGGSITLGTRIANTGARPPSLDGYPEDLLALLAGCLAEDPAARPTPAELTACDPGDGPDGWLPGPLTAVIARREQAVLHPPAPSDPAAGTTFPPGPAAGTTLPPAPPAPVGTAAQFAAGPVPPAHTARGTGPHPAPVPLPHPYPTQPQPRQPVPNRRRALLLGGAVIVAATVALIWSQNRPDGSADDNTGARPPAGTQSEETSGSSAPSSSPTPKPRYTVVYKDKPLLIRAPGWQDTTMIDFDAPRLNPDGGSNTEDKEGQEIRYFNGVSRMEFITPAGTSTAPTPEACQDAVNTAVLQDLNEDQLKDGKTLGKGTLLCTVTSDGNLAMMKILDSDLVPGDFKVPGFDTELTLWKINE